jgi:sirohydrochlorin ferrochelatase
MLQHEMKTALLLIAHGSRRAEANADLDDLARQLRARGSYAIVAHAYLELAEPTIEMAVNECLSQGAQCVLLAPYFLSAGVHATRDLEQHRRRLAEAHPAADFRLCEPIGRHPLMAEIISARAREAEHRRP